MGSLFGYRHVSAERHGLTRAHYDRGWRVLHKKSDTAMRLSRPGESFTGTVYWIGAHKWVGYSNLLAGDLLRVDGARTMRQAIDLLERAEAQRQAEQATPEKDQSDVRSAAARRLAVAFGAS